MTHMFQFYTSHWTGTIFWGLKIKGHNGPPQVQSTFTCKETRRKRTQTHTLQRKCCRFPSCETTSKCQNNNRRWDFVAEILKLTTIMAPAVFKKLINWSAISSFAIATSDKGSSMRSTREQQTVGKGCQLGKLYSAPSRSSALRGDDKEHQLISKK